MPEERGWDQQEGWPKMPVTLLEQPTLQVIANATCKGNERESNEKEEIKKKERIEGSRSLALMDLEKEKKTEKKRGIADITCETSPVKPCMTFD